MSQVAQAPLLGARACTRRSNARRMSYRCHAAAPETHDAALPVTAPVTLQLPRRAALAACLAAAATVVAPGRSSANPLDDLLAAKRKTNAKFLIGPIQLARLRLADAQKLSAEEAAVVRCASALASALSPAHSRSPARTQAVNKAALDCLTIEAANLREYSKYREVPDVFARLTCLMRSLTRLGTGVHVSHRGAQRHGGPRRAARARQRGGCGDARRRGRNCRVRPQVPC